MEKKYELTDDFICHNGRILYRIRALRDFSNVRAGDLGGYIQTEHNLSHEGNAWVYDDAKVFDNAEVSGKVEVYGNAHIVGNAKVNGKADYIVFKNFWSSGRYFTWTRSNNKWKAGCFHGTGEELINKAYADSEKSGREYERVVRYVESILADEEKEDRV